MNWPKLKSYDKGFFQEGRNGIILGEALNIFGEKCHFIRNFYCLKSFHDPKLGEVHASVFHWFHPPWPFLIGSEF